MLLPVNEVVVLLINKLDVKRRRVLAAAAADSDSGSAARAAAAAQQAGCLWTVLLGAVSRGGSRWLVHLCRRAANRLAAAAPPALPTSVAVAACPPAQSAALATRCDDPLRRQAE